MGLDFERDGNKASADLTKRGEAPRSSPATAPNASGFVPLTAGDREVLRGRGRLLGRMMKFFYLLPILGLAVLTAKEVFVYGELTVKDAQDMFFFAALFGGTLGVTHALLACYERRVGRAVRADLSAGTKVRKVGTLVGVRDGAEAEPTRLKLRDELTGEYEEFALRTVGDLIRIEPGPLVGKRVEIEYGPNSGVVLRLRESSAEPSRDAQTVRRVDGQGAAGQATR